MLSKKCSRVIQETLSGMLHICTARDVDTAKKMRTAEGDKKRI